VEEWHVAQWEECAGAIESEGLEAEVEGVANDEGLLNGALLHRGRHACAQMIHSSLSVVAVKRHSRLLLLMHVLFCLDCDFKCGSAYCLFCLLNIYY
jgi:hypothetical protein